MKPIEYGIIGLIALVVLGAWFAGLSTDAQSFGAAINNLVNTLQGRNAQGNFPSYPGNAPTVTTQALQG